MIIHKTTLALLLFSFFLTEAIKFEDSEKDYKEWKEFQEFQRWKKSKSGREKELISSENSDGEKENTQIIREDDKSGERNFEKPRKKENEKKIYEKSKYFDKKRVYDKKKDNDKKKDFEKKKRYEKKREYERIAQMEPDENDRNDPPPINEAALMARYIVNEANWTSVATISSRKDIKSFPSANVISFSDGLVGNGSGIPYMFLTPLDFTAQDLYRDSRATLMMTLAQGRYCSKKNYDPMDPRCARVILTGKIKPVKNDSAEIEIAKNAVFGRHPWLENMPADHHFFFAKLKIASIAMLDTFGGPKFVTVKDYLHPPTSNTSRVFPQVELKESSDFDLVSPDVRLV
ncbi:protein CREG1 [Belonocnema kinseyi]|uniref:protein CREG1 n=1 Tax=Belonocnema kinseyi TaxID=2817044 RepID=UPI00143D2591|nr:protein CREG1 [Belonocnema kinseyi]